MAQPPQKKPPKQTRAKASQRNDGSELNDYFEEFFENAQPHQLDETPAPEQQRQWISDQLMWETTLGMREDETITRAITPEADAKTAATPSAGPTPARKRPLSDQERQLLRTQVIEPAPLNQSQSPKLTAKPDRKSAPAVPRSQATRPQHGGQKPAPQQGQPLQQSSVQQPNAQQSRAQASARQNTARQGPTATSSKAPVKSVPQATQTAPQKRPPSQAASGEPRRVPTAARHPGGNAAANRGSKSAAAKNSAPQAKRQAPAQTPHTQTQPVIREADLTMGEQIEFDLDTEFTREKYFKYGLKTAAVLAIALISFTIGYYVGGKNSIDTAKPADLSAALGEIDSVTAKKITPAAAQKPLPKKPKPKPSPARRNPAQTDSSFDVANEVPDKATDQSDINHDNRIQSAAVFQGREIETEQFGQDQRDIGAADTSAQQAIDPYDSFNKNGLNNKTVNNNAGDNAANNDTFNNSPNSSLNEAPKTANFLPPGQSTEAAAPADGTASANALQPATEHQELQALLDQSLKSFQAKQWQTVIALSNQILAIDPTAVTALTNRAAANTELGFYQEALADCNTAIKMEPNNPLAINNRGYVYEKMGDTANAVANYEKACALEVELSCKEVQRLKAGTPQ